MKNDKQRIADLERRVKELEARPPVIWPTIITVPVPSPMTAPYMPPVNPYVPPVPWYPQPYLPSQPTWVGPQDRPYVTCGESVAVYSFGASMGPVTTPRSFSTEQ